MSHACPNLLTNTSLSVSLPLSFTVCAQSRPSSQSPSSQRTLRPPGNTACNLAYLDVSLLACTALRFCRAMTIIMYTHLDPPFIDNRDALRCTECFTTRTRHAATHTTAMVQSRKSDFKMVQIDFHSRTNATVQRALTGTFVHLKLCYTSCMCVCVCVRMQTCFASGKLTGMP